MNICTVSFFGHRQIDDVFKIVWGSHCGNVPAEGLFGVYRVILIPAKYSLQGTTQGRYLTGGVPPVRFSM